ncbi:unnamed protein product [Gongylonema pulchrum]|uniref:Transmembrane protein n=1 Tax=Gongylonema pulchrum TaxID=637853 RepID=A0A183DE46_9BILA|nr:unnamed protein product [Gongylonema pulchrum]
MQQDEGAGSEDEMSESISELPSISEIARKRPSALVSPVIVSLDIIFAFSLLSKIQGKNMPFLQKNLHSIFLLVI